MRSKRKQTIPAPNNQRERKRGEVTSAEIWLDVGTAEHGAKSKPNGRQLLCARD